MFKISLIRMFCYRPNNILLSSPSRQIRVLPGLGKVHIVHTYDRIVPYVGHKRLTVVTSPPKIYATRSSVLQKEYDWIENKLRPWVAYSPTNRYLNSKSAVRYVYVRDPVTGLKYSYEYPPSRSFFRVFPSLGSLSNHWSDYKPLNLWYDYWPYYSRLSNLDIVPSYQPLKLQRIWLKYFPNTENRLRYFRYYFDWPYYCYTYPYYKRRDIFPIWYDYWRMWKYYNFPTKSLYWFKYTPICEKLNNFSYANSKFFKNIFDDETKLIRAQMASLLKQIHLPVPRTRSWAITPLNRYGDYSSLPVKYSNDTYIHRLLTVAPNSKIHYATYYTEPVKKYIGQGHLSCVSYAGDKSYSRRRPLTIYEDALRNDIQLLSYYINKFRQEKSQPKEIQAPLSSIRPSRIFSVHKPIEDPIAQEIKDLKEARAKRLAKIYERDDVENGVKSKRQREEMRLAEESAIFEEQKKQEILTKKAQAEKQEKARKVELERQKQLAAQAAAERVLKLEKEAERARQKELENEAEAARIRQIEEERILQEEQQRIEAEAKAEEERKQLLRLEEIARQAEEEKEAELVRQAEELAELAKQEAELAELERQEKEQKEKERKEAELARQQAELEEQEKKFAELAIQEAELAELARQEAELAELAKEKAELSELREQEEQLAELARQEAELTELERQEAELAELARQEAELTELANQEAELADLSRQETELAELVKQEKKVMQPTKHKDDLIEAAEEDAELIYNDDFQPKEIDDYDTQNQQFSRIQDIKPSEIIFETEDKQQVEVIAEKTVPLQEEEFNAFFEE